MKKYLLIKIFIVFAINILFLLKYHNDGDYFLISCLIINFILFFSFCYLYKNSFFFIFLKKYIGVSSLFLIVGAIFVSIYYKEKSNDIGMLIILFTLSDVAFLLYFIFHEYLYKKLKLIKIKRIAKEIKSDMNFNKLSSDFYYRKSDSSNELKTPLNNPSSGLPMINSGIDIGGNAYGSHHKK